MDPTIGCSSLLQHYHAPYFSSNFIILGVLVFYCTGKEQ